MKRVLPRVTNAGESAASANEQTFTWYETPFGPGLLIWQGPLLVRHKLPGTAPGDESVQLPASGNTHPRHQEQQDLIDSLEAYFQGERIEFPASTLPIDWSARTPFGQKVARALAAVRYGEVASYAGLAAAAGNPRAARAVGNFMAANPFPLLLPCHRVIRSDGRPGGFSGGRHWKRRLLQIEGVELPFRPPWLSNRL